MKIYIYPEIMIDLINIRILGNLFYLLGFNIGRIGIGQLMIFYFLTISFLYCLFDVSLVFILFDYDNYA